MLVRLVRPLHAVLSTMRGKHLLVLWHVVSVLCLGLLLVLVLVLLSLDDLAARGLLLRSRRRRVPVPETVALAAAQDAFFVLPTLVVLVCAARQRTVHRAVHRAMSDPMATSTSMSRATSASRVSMSYARAVRIENFCIMICACRMLVLAGSVALCVCVAVFAGSELAMAGNTMFGLFSVPVTASTSPAVLH